MGLFNFKSNHLKYKLTFAHILGWKNFCDCKLHEPYFHTHTLSLSKDKDGEVKSKYKCNDCEFYFVFDYAIFGHGLDFNNCECRVYKCPICREKLSICRNLVFDFTHIIGDYMSKEEKNNKEKIILLDLSIPHPYPFDFPIENAWYLAFQAGENGEYTANCTFSKTGNIAEDLESFKICADNLIIGFNKVTGNSSLVKEKKHSNPNNINFETLVKEKIEVEMMLIGKQKRLNEINVLIENYIKGK